MNNMCPFHFQSSDLVRHSNSHCRNTVVKLMANLKEKDIRGMGHEEKKKSRKEYAIHEIFLITNRSELMCCFVLQ